MRHLINQSGQPLVNDALPLIANRIQLVETGNRSRHQLQAVCRIDGPHVDSVAGVEARERAERSRPLAPTNNVEDLACGWGEVIQE